VLGLGVIWWARRGIDGAVATEGSADANDAPKLAEIEAILIAVLGVYFLCDGFTDLIRTTGWISFNVIANGAPLGVMIRFHSVSYGVGFRNRSSAHPAQGGHRRASRANSGVGPRRSSLEAI
jgi:hypothetical protein